MPDIRNCRRCNKVFNFLGGVPICPQCKEKDEEDFVKVKKFLYENPKATMAEVSEGCDVSVERIKKYLRDGRLEIVGGEEGNIVLDCEVCGKPISTGRFCKHCSDAMTLGLNHTAKDMKEDMDRKNDDKLKFRSVETGKQPKKK